jgi:capsular polysaccharide biosynthesis protein
MVAVREYSPFDTFQNLLNRWWWIVLLALIGGSVGWVFHRMQPPTYEARAVLTAIIDYTQTAPLTEYDHDLTIGIVMAVMLSKDVIDETIIKAQNQQVPVQGLKYGSTIFLERKHSVLELIVRDANPQFAAALANLWAETAYETLVEAKGNAVQARVLRGQLIALEKCMQLPVTSSDKPEICSGFPAEDIPGKIQALEPRVQEAEIKTMGIIPPLYFELSQKAAVPSSPVAYGTNVLVFSGAMIGFIAGVLVVSRKRKSFPE